MPSSSQHVFPAGAGTNPSLTRWRLAGPSGRSARNLKQSDFGREPQLLCDRSRCDRTRLETPDLGCVLLNRPVGRELASPRYIDNSLSVPAVAILVGGI